MNYFITGGGCIVENSTFGLNRKTAFLKKLSQETGVHIVAGTGIEIPKFLNPKRYGLFGQLRMRGGVKMTH